MKEHVNLENILNIYEKEIAKNVKNKRKIYMFERNKIQNITEIETSLLQRRCIFNKYNIFLVKEPKHRIVMALNIKDKIINHFISRYVLEEKLSKYLDERNIATRKKMGTDYGIQLLKKDLEKNKKYQHFYILKLDISKYFYSISHQVLKSMLKDKLNPDEYEYINSIIDSTNCEYINKKIDEIKEKYVLKHPNTKRELDAIPYYYKGRGLPIGNMTSQFLSIFYLYELDHYIVHNLHIKYYIRYMDDFILIHHDKKVLEKALEEIRNILEHKYLLKLNDKKTKITREDEGVVFLGYRFRIINHKTIVTLKKSSVEKIKKRVKTIAYMYKNGYIDFNSAFSSIMSFWNNRKYGSVLKIRRIIERYWFQNLDGL